jgi:AcrR family transcriptional regulator
MSDPHQPFQESSLDRDALARRRRAILEATASVCAEKGYPELNVAAIADRAGFATNAFREVFPDEQEAFLELLSSEGERLLGRVEEACGQTGADPVSRVERGLRTVLEWVDENPRDAQVCIVESIRATTRVFEWRKQTLDRFVALLRTAAPAVFSESPELLGELMVAGVYAVLVRRLERPTPGLAVNLAPELTELLLGTYPNSGGWSLDGWKG